MNKSWRSNSNNSSPGFVYFNTNNSFQSQNSDTSEYLSFASDSSPGGSPQPKQFCPSNYSSPRVQKYDNRSSRNWTPRNQGYQNNQSGSGQNSYWRKGGGYRGHNEKHVNNHQNNESFKIQKRDSHNTSGFYDHTCLWNPWRELEEKLATEKARNVEQKQASQNEIENDAQSSSEESNSEESEEESEENVTES